MSQKVQRDIRINRDQWEKEGFLLEITPHQYLIGLGPFIVSHKPDENQWSLFHPPFFFSSQKNKENYWYIPSVIGFFSKEQMLTFLDPYKENKKLSHWQWNEPCVSHFQNFFSKTMKQINTGNLQKIVPAVFENNNLYIKNTGCITFNLSINFSFLGQYKLCMLVGSSGYNW